MSARKVAGDENGILQNIAMDGKLTRLCHPLRAGIALVFVSVPALPFLLWRCCLCVKNGSFLYKRLEIEYMKSPRLLSC